MTAIALTIAGSDSSGGAGIQADLKTFTVHGVYGASAITALTAQNTRGVIGVMPVAPEFVRLQIDAVVSDLRVDAAKTGMLANAGIIRAVADAVHAQAIRQLVVDPVMIAQSGARLLDADAVDVLRRELLPLAAIVTPNLPEAEALTGIAINDVNDMRRAAAALRELGARACLIKGGHFASGPAVDVLLDGQQTIELRTERIATRHTHGTGCQLSAAITANLARGVELEAAVRAAKEFITVAIGAGLAIGSGDGPANPMAWRRLS